MRKALAVGLAVGMLAAAMVAPADAGPKKKKKKPAAPVERVVEGAYTCPCGVQAAGRGPGFILGSGEGGFTLPTLGGEKTFTVELTDESGQPVFFKVAQDTDGDNISETAVTQACGKTAEPAEIPNEGGELNFFVYSGTCDVGIAVATGGSYKVTFNPAP